MAQELQHEKCVLWRIESNYRIPPFQVKFNQNRWVYRFRFFSSKKQKSSVPLEFRSKFEKNCLIKNLFKKCFYHHHNSYRMKTKCQNQIDRRTEPEKISNKPYALQSTFIMCDSFLLQKKNMTILSIQFLQVNQNKRKSMIDSWCSIISLVCMCVFCLLQKDKRLQFTKSVVRFKSIEIKMSP